MRLWKQYEASERLLVAVSACNLSLLAFFDGKNIDQAVQIEAGWKIF